MEFKEKIKSIYQKSGLTPPFFRTICQDLDLDKKNATDILHMLIDEKSIVKTKDDLYFDAVQINTLEQKLVKFLKEKESISTPDFKEMTGLKEGLAIKTTQAITVVVAFAVVAALFYFLNKTILVAKRSFMAIHRPQFSLYQV